MADIAEGSAPDLAARLQGDLAALDGELAEIEMLVGQARAEASRHEQKRAQAADKLAAPGRKAEPSELADGYKQLVALTRRAAVMEAQVDVLEGKLKVLARYRAALAAVADQLSGTSAGGSPADAMPVLTANGGGGESLAAPMSRVVLSAQEDLRREIARAMHDGPAQSLTNIVLQAQIVQRLIERGVPQGHDELNLLVSMVQQTLDATKSFIFDVRPMVLDDLGLVPTLRRSTRERGRRSHVPVEFESMGQDRRMSMDVESATFRILDEAMAAYLALSPDRVVLRLDWTDGLEAYLAAHRAPALPSGEPLPEMPTGDVPDALKQMIQDRHDARDAAVTAAHEAAVVSLPAAARRDALERAASIGATLEMLAGGSELRLVVPMPPSDLEGEAPA